MAGFALNIDDGPEGKLDWKAEIETDKVIRPAPGVVWRFLVILRRASNGDSPRGGKAAGGVAKERGVVGNCPAEFAGDWDWVERYAG